MAKHVISPNPHPVGSAEARAWEAGYWQGRRDLVEQTEVTCSHCGTAHAIVSGEAALVVVHCKCGSTVNSNGATFWSGK